MTGTLEDRLRRMEAMEAIRQCVYHYALAGDRGNDPAIVAQLFTENGSYEAVGFGRFEGRANIVDGLATLGKSTVIWSFHVPAGPLIRLADDVTSASAFWWAWVPVTLRIGGEDRPHWGAGHYNADLLVEAGSWKFHRVLFRPKLQTPFDGPWTTLEGPVEGPG